MTISSSSHQIHISTIAIDGRLDAVRAVDLRSEIASAIDGGVFRIIVDLAQATFVDSAGLAALAKGMKDCRLHQGDLRVVAPQHEDAQRVFTLTRFDQVFTMGESADALISQW